MDKIMKYYMGIDVGTNETKGVIVDTFGKIIEFASCRHEMNNPQEGWFEMDAEMWWNDVCVISKELLNKSAIDSEDIQVLGFSALGCDCVSVDENGNPLMKAILYGIDHRSEPQIKELYEVFKEDAEKMIGHELCSSDIAPKILWIKENLPEVYNKTYKFLTASSFLCAKLTGKYVIDRYLAEDFLPLYDLKEDKINTEEACSYFCKPEQMAELKGAMDIVGTITPQASKQTGLSIHTKVLCGTGDSGAEALSTGVCTPHDLMVQMGSTCYFVYLNDQPLKSDIMWPSTFILPDTYCLLAGTNAAGTFTKWFKDELFQEYQEDAYTQMATLIQDIPAGSEGLITLPYVAGERTPINDPNAKGMIFGLKLLHTKAHLYQSALEGIAHSIAQHVHLIEKKYPIKKIMLVGGGTKNDKWVQIVADVLGREVRVNEVSIGACYGDALMALKADGVYQSWDELEKQLGNSRKISPNMKNHEIYKKHQEIFDELYIRNKDFMYKL